MSVITIPRKLAIEGGLYCLESGTALSYHSADESALERVFTECGLA
jgi:hypothetical protein